MDCEHALTFKQAAKLADVWSISRPITYTCETCRRSCELEYGAGLRILADVLPVALALCAGLLTALVYTGLETTLRAAPLLSLPAAAAGALCLGRRESP